MKKIYFVLLALSILCAPIEGATVVKDKNNCNCHKSYKPKKYHTMGREERLNEINFRLDILKDRYKRDKKRLEYSSVDKYDLKIRQKELKYQYQKEERRLKAEKKAVKESARR